MSIDPLQELGEVLDEALTQWRSKAAWYQRRPAWHRRGHELIGLAVKQRQSTRAENERITLALRDAKIDLAYQEVLAENPEFKAIMEPTLHRYGLEL